MSEFRAWPKTPRLYRNCIATEKIDGTNCAVIVEPLDGPDATITGDCVAAVALPDGQSFGVYAQSRKRLIHPNSAEDKAADNFGFAAWVRDNALELVAGLGEGYHYGEWWGSGIQRAYGLKDGERHFSLFNAGRWHDRDANGCGESVAPDCCRVVPVLATGVQIQAVAEGALALLEDEGSFAAPGFDNPEGIVVFHAAARQTFKVTLDNDGQPKSAVKS